MRKWGLSRSPLVLGALLLFAFSAVAQTARREPHIGYLYPAGGQRGTTFEVTAGGQMLQRVTGVHVTGEGVRASITRYVGRLDLKGEEGREFQRRLTEAWKARMVEFTGRPLPAAPPSAAPAEPVVLPDHPLIANLESKSLRELAFLRREAEHFRQRQQNAQIAETVLIQVDIDPNAAAGDRAIRLITPAGLTNPLVFEVGTLPEIREGELNDPDIAIDLPVITPTELPVLLNGQVTPGDVDRFRFNARAGQRLVLDAHARRLIPYLADAVPGWFQATVALYDARGREVAFADDFRFSPDPVLFCEVPADGVYEMEIRDAIYRGREDFVYRVAVGELPYITQVFPLGACARVETVASAAGWNLPASQLPFDTHAGPESIRLAALTKGPWLSNNVLYMVDDLSDRVEAEPNDTPDNAQAIRLPLTVNGRIDRSGDRDSFQFEGHAGDEVVAEVYARRLQSPLDSLLRLTDASGTVIAWNDDVLEKEGHLFKGDGLLTHEADSYLRARLPQDGLYRVQVSDTQEHGGKAYAYRLRLAPPRPDFALRATPSSLNVPVGRAVPLCVYVQRKDGFEGDVEIALKDAPPGFALTGGVVPAGRESIRMTLTGPRERIDQPFALRLEGRAVIAGQTVSRPVAPAEDLMQAFLYRHLVPSQQFVVAVIGPKRGGPGVAVAAPTPIEIPAGGMAGVLVRTPKVDILPFVRLELNSPPAGITLENVQVAGEGLTFQLKTDPEKIHAGYVDNLIVEAHVLRDNKRNPLGFLPALPIRIVSRP